MATVRTLLLAPHRTARAAQLGSSSLDCHRSARAAVRQLGSSSSGGSSSTLALPELTSQLLAMRHAPPCRETIARLTELLPPTPVSIRTLQRAAEMQARSAEQALLNAKFVRRELLARRAHILSLLLAVPSELARQPAVQLLTTAYWQRLLFLLEQPRMTNAGDELEFAGRLRLRFEEQVEVFPLIAPDCVRWPH
jgi:hypothetical protein